MTDQLLTQQPGLGRRRDLSRNFLIIKTAGETEGLELHARLIKEERQQRSDERATHAFSRKKKGFGFRAGM